jgi:hypothetical protein
MRTHRNKELHWVLRIALYLLKKNGSPKPSKQQVLNFIRLQGLLRPPFGDTLGTDAIGTGEVTENDIALRRKDLEMDGEITGSERGHWILTKHGVSKVEAKRTLWCSLESTSERTRVLDIYPYWSEDLLYWMRRIAKGDDLNLSTRQH